MAGFVTPVASGRPTPSIAAMPSPFGTAFSAAGLFVLLALPGTARAQDTGQGGNAPSGADAARAAAPVDPMALPRPSLAVRATTGAITVDGRLDEPAWQSADSTVGPFWLNVPVQGVPQSNRTVVRVLQDADALYFGAVLYDARPDAIVSSGLQQDFPPVDGDMFAVMLDTYHDRTNGYVFGVNPAGAIWDAQSFNDSRDVEGSWEGVTEAHTARFEGGWSVELRIPFTTVRYRPSAEPQTWGLNIMRRLKHRNEDAMWAPLPRQFRPYKFSVAGTLTGVRVTRPARNLGVKPYVLANTTAGAEVDGATTGAVGVDAKWGITPRLTLDATVNTDFSQVEVDQQQVNLTRFSLFFPEKRDFFLENQGTFAFQDVQIRNYRTGSGPSTFRLFHSRRIGLSADRQPVPILGGARLTGRAAGFEVGVLEMQTRRNDLGPAENFGVARLKRDLGGGLVLGGLVVNRQATAGSEAWNRSYGVDANWSPLPPLLVSAYAARADYGGGWDARLPDTATHGDRGTAMLQAAWRDDLWDTSVLLKHVGDAFDPGAGFVARRGVRRLFATVGAHPQPRLPGVAEVNPYVDLDWFTNLDGVMETRQVSPGIGVTFNDTGVLTVERSTRYERLFEPLSVAGGRVPAGTYRFAETTLSYKANGGRPLSGNVSVSRGGFYDGTRTSVGGSLRWRPDPRLSLELGAQRNALVIGGEAIDANLYSLKADLARDTRTFLMGFVQYNQATRELVGNVRFNFIHAPLSDVFLVWTERRSLLSDEEVARTRPDDLLGWSPLRQRGLTLKVTRLVAF